MICFLGGAVAAIGGGLVDKAVDLIGGGGSDGGGGSVSTAAGSNAERRRIRKEQRRARREVRKNMRRRQRLQDLEVAAGLRSPFERRAGGGRRGGVTPVSASFVRPVSDMDDGFGLSDLVPAFEFGDGAACGDFFRTSPIARATARPWVAVPKPGGGETFYRHVGQPLLFSGDLATSQRVGKLAARARRSRGR